MFALSLPKILLTLAVIAAVVFYYKRGEERARDKERASKEGSDASPANAAISMKACPRCGVYVGEDDLGAGVHECAKK